MTINLHENNFTLQTQIMSIDPTQKNKNWVLKNRNLMEKCSLISYVVIII